MPTPTQQPGVASTSRMRTTISPGQLEAMDSCFGLLGRVGVSMCYLAFIIVSQVKVRKRKAGTTEKENRQPLNVTNELQEERLTISQSIL